MITMAQAVVTLLEIQRDLPLLQGARRRRVVTKLVKFAADMEAAGDRETAFDFLRHMLSTSDGVGHA
jgi:hypothetical protein